MTVAIGLTAILLTLLFRFLMNNAQFERKVDQASAKVLERQRLGERLETILTSLQPVSKESVALYTLPFPDDEVVESLVVSFNAGIDPDPEYSHVVTGRIFVTDRQELALVYWPLNKEGYRTEVLLQNVRGLEWQFLGQKLDKDPKIPVIANNWAWLSKWPKERKTVPEIIRLKIWCGIEKTRHSEPNLQWAFILPTLTPIQP